MKETQMPPSYAVNLVANSGNTAYRAESIAPDKKTWDVVTPLSFNSE